MCIIINQPKGITITDKVLKSCYKRNSHGFGAMYKENGKVKVIKSLGKYNDIKRIYDSLLKSKACVIHFRMQTHGDINQNNIHPFKITKNLYMAHNGILSGGNPEYKEKSDTWHFINYILKPSLERKPQLIYNKNYIEFLGKTIGNSRFAFMNNKGYISIVNKDDGVEHGGCWFSNTYAWDAPSGLKRPKFSSLNWDSYDDYDGTTYTHDYTTGKWNQLEDKSSVKNNMSLPDNRTIRDMTLIYNSILDYYDTGLLENYVRQYTQDSIDMINYAHQEQMELGDFQDYEDLAEMLCQSIDSGACDHLLDESQIDFGGESWNK